jgi:hypothetical protein
MRIALAAVSVSVALWYGTASIAQDLGLPAITLEAPEAQESLTFGEAVAFGDVDNDGNLDVLIGAGGADVSTDAGIVDTAGRAFVFLGPHFSTVITLDDPDPSDQAFFGAEIASGDVNNDGNDDVVVGAPEAEDVSGASVLPAAGQAFLFFGPSLNQAVPLVPPDPDRGDRIGANLAVGDINNDGKDDVAVGAPNAEVDPGSGDIESAGQVFVFWGPDLQTVTTLEDPNPQDDAQFGRGLAIVDVNNDGKGDLAVGARRSHVDPGTGVVPWAGEAFVFLGPDLVQVIPLQSPEPDPSAAFGISLAGGDFNNDGDDDVLVGAPRSDVDTATETIDWAGKAFVFLGPDLGTVTTLKSVDPEAFALFGLDVAAGDVNNDGSDDAIVGEDSSSVDTAGGPLARAGKAFVFLGPTFSTVLPLEDPDPEQNAFFGLSLSAGDANNDGRDDAIVSAIGSDVDPGPGKGNVKEGVGQVFLFRSLEDSDGDGIPDVLDPDPGGSDADGDGVPDGSDPDTVGVQVAALPSGAFAGGGHRTAILSRLENIEQSADMDDATQQLKNLRRKVDGCGETADNNDWIVDCDAQQLVRDLIDVLIANLGG